MKCRVIVALIVITLVSCTPASTSAPASTSTPNEPTELVGTGSGSLSGTIFLVSSAPQAIKPFAFAVKLRQTNGNEINGSIDTQKYEFENITPGVYELWVLIPYSGFYFSSCFDIGLPDEKWKLGRLLGNNQTTFIVDTNYRDALIQAKNADPASQDSYDFYAVLGNLEIKAADDNRVDIELVCKSSQ